MGTNIEDYISASQVKEIVVLMQIDIFYHLCITSGKGAEADRIAVREMGNKDVLVRSIESNKELLGNKVLFNSQFGPSWTPVQVKAID